MLSEYRVSFDGIIANFYCLRKQLSYWFQHCRPVNTITHELVHLA